MCALICPPVHAQFWDKLTKPQITVNLTHPPRLGLNIKKVAFGPSNGECSDEILDRLSGVLISGGVEVLDRHTLHRLLAERHYNMGGYVDRQSAMQMGKLLGPTAMIFVKISRCNAEHRRNYTDAKNRKGEVVRTFHAITELHIRGTLQTIDLATGRIFSASPIFEDAALENQSTDGEPEAPPANVLRDGAIDHAAYEASTMFVQWNEEKKLYFFNDKECNLSVAFTLLKANDLEGTVRQSEENIEACKTWPKLKDNSVAHAYYNAGLAYLLINEHEKALSYLTESAKLKGGDIVTETISEANNSARLEAEMQRVAERTEQFEQSQANINSVSQPAAGGAPKPSSDSAEERLRKLDALFKKGLITKQEYDAKKAQILKDI